VRTSHAAKTSTSSWRLQSNIISAGSQAKDFSHQDGDIEEQETGVDLASKLPQIVQIVNNAKAPRTAYSTALNSPRGTTFFDSTLSPGFNQHGPPISAYKYKPPRK